MIPFISGESCDFPNREASVPGTRSTSFTMNGLQNSFSMLNVNRVINTLNKSAGPGNFDIAVHSDNGNFDGIDMWGDEFDDDEEYSV